MSANLYRQSKEIAVLRAIGFTKMRIRMLYFYEALVLVLASSILGTAIGLAVGYTQMLQESLLLGKDLTLTFPWIQFLIIMGCSLMCAFFATFGPVSQLTAKQISQIFRLV